MTTTDLRSASAEAFTARLAEIEAATPDPDGAVERVARAIYEKATEATPFAQGWDNIGHPRQELYRLLAQAAIDAMQAPAAFDPTATLRRVEKLAKLYKRFGEDEKMHPKAADAFHDVALDLSLALSSPAGPDGDGGAE